MMYVMSGNRPVVEFDGNTYEYDILDKALAPLYITNRGNIRRWIEERAVDPTRANSRAVKSVQGLSKNASDYITAMKVDAATITDDYWIKDSNDTRSFVGNDYQWHRLAIKSCEASDYSISHTCRRDSMISMNAVSGTVGSPSSS